MDGMVSDEKHSVALRRRKPAAALSPRDGWMKNERHGVLFIRKHSWLPSYFKGRRSPPLSHIHPSRACERHGVLFIRKHSLLPSYFKAV